MTPEQHYLNTTLGMASSCLAVLSTFQEDLDWIIRISGGFALLTISCITIYRMVRNRPTKHKYPKRYE